MYRQRWTCEVKYGHYRDFFETIEELEKLIQARGWKPSRFWMPTSGKDNQFISETDYDSLAEWEQENQAFMKDAEVMDVIRRGTPHVVQGSSYNELLVTAEQIA